MWGQVRGWSFAALGLALVVGTAAVAEEEPPGSVEPLIGAEGVETLVNLHPDEVRAKLYAVNYQQPGLIPMCTEVELTELSRKRLTFRVIETGKTYNYDYHKAAVEPFAQHLARYFGRSCDRERADELGETDRRGIREGRVVPGMTKEGVVFAIGYPPPHVTPSLDSPRWKYWKSRFDTMDVVFDDAGVVTEIVD